ncbi:hypothetical protein M5K25_005657 [Dendrobium thyrsiflorum]|uniref:Uncharacterized protein n=1 Tax=Dendrobium thyrsiflorum TaxID=117978 RepID=A0ABD0VIE7_DENTH
MFCGVSSFSHVDDELSSPSTPRGTKKKHSSTNNKNPYSSRGLEKYNSVLSELEAKKEKIMAGRTGSVDGEVPMVRFMYSKSQDWVPIVVRLKDENNSSPLSPKKTAPAQSRLKAELLNPPALLSPKTKARKHVTWCEGDGGRTEGACAMKNA